MVIDAKSEEEKCPVPPESLFMAVHPVSTLPKNGQNGLSLQKLRVMPLITIHPCRKITNAKKNPEELLFSGPLRQCCVINFAKELPESYLLPGLCKFRIIPHGRASAATNYTKNILGVISW